ncbi:MAG: hypothetical protein WD875_09525 [Pirellulales bacterium]
MKASLNLLALLLVAGTMVVWLASASQARGENGAQSSEDETTALAARVAKLIEGLDASRLADRDAAEKALVALGPSALDVLPQGDGKLSAEVKQRLVRVRRQLELAFAKSAAKASLISLGEAERPFSKILAALARQSDNPLVDGRAASQPSEPPADPRIRSNFTDTPFWQALDRTLDAAGCSLAIRDASGDEPLRLVVVSRRDGERPRGQRVAYRGPLRFELADIDVKRDAAAAAGGLLRVVLETAWEPRLRPISFSLSAGDLAATDDRARPLGVATPQANWGTTSLGGQGAIRLSLPFAMTEDATSFSLKGRMTALLPGADVVFRFGNLDAKKPAAASATAPLALQTIGDATVRLESFRRHDDRWEARWEARFRVIYDNPQEAVQSHFDWLYKSRAALTVADKRREPIRYDAQAAEEGVVATYSFPARDGDQPGDFSLLYTTPAVILSLPYEFEFRDVPLPR